MEGAEKEVEMVAERQAGTEVVGKVVGCGGDGGGGDGGGGDGGGGDGGG